MSRFANNQSEVAGANIDRQECAKGISMYPAGSSCSRLARTEGGRPRRDNARGGRKRRRACATGWHSNIYRTVQTAPLLFHGATMCKFNLSRRLKNKVRPCERGRADGARSGGAGGAGEERTAAAERSIINPLGIIHCDHSASSVRACAPTSCSIADSQSVSGSSIVYPSYIRRIVQFRDSQTGSG